MGAQQLGKPSTCAHSISATSACAGLTSCTKRGLYVAALKSVAARTEYRHNLHRYSAEHKLGSIDHNRKNNAFWWSGQHKERKVSAALADGPGTEDDAGLPVLGHGRRVGNGGRARSYMPPPHLR